MLICIGLGGVAALLTASIGYDPPAADIKYDWLSAWGALHGNAYEDSLSLARSQGVDLEVIVPSGFEGDAPPPNPRLPGSILLLLPLTLVPFAWVFPIWTGISVAITLLLAMQVVRARGRRTTSALAISAVVLAAAPSFINLRYAGQAAIVAALALTSWCWSTAGSETRGGVLLGLAAVLKVFPLVLIIPLLVRRRFVAAVAAVSVFVALSTVGLGLPGVSLTSSLRALSSASLAWVGMLGNGSFFKLAADIFDGSLASWLLPVGLFAVLMAVGYHNSHVHGELYFWLPIGLLLSPISWISYDVVLIPAVLSLVLSESRDRHLLGIACMGMWWAPTILYPFALLQSGYFAMAVRLALIGAVLAGWAIDRPHNHGLQATAQAMS